MNAREGTQWRRQKRFLTWTPPDGTPIITSGNPNDYQALDLYFPFFLTLQVSIFTVIPGNTKGRSITVTLTSCLTGLESAV